MRTSAWTCFAALLLAVPAFAQDDVTTVPVEDPAAEAPAGEAPATDSGEAAPVEEVPAEAAASGEATAEETAATDEAAAEEPAERTPLALYVGADWVRTTLSLSTGGATGASELDSGMYRARVGWRALEAVGVEVQLGMDNSDSDPGSVETELYGGVFIVPTATIFEVVELAFPVGYAQSTFGTAGGTSEDYRSVAYGIDAELPLRSFGESLPDVRFTAGWMVYYQKSDARAYGANAGLRYDFSF